MANVTSVNHPIISSYLESFAKLYGISKKKRKDEHALFEKFVNDIILKSYENDINAQYENMETGSAFGIDGVALFVNERMVINEGDIDYICSGTKKISVHFVFTQSKVSNYYDRNQVQDFLVAINRFFNLDRCEIPELEEIWGVVKYLYSKSSKFKDLPSITMYFATLSSKDLDRTDIHMKATLDKGIDDLKQKFMFNEKQIAFEDIGLKKLTSLYRKLNSNLEVTFTLDKQPVPYPKDYTKKVLAGYFGLIKLDSLLEVLTDEIDGKKKLKKGIFEDNIRDYLGANEDVEVNLNMAQEIKGDNAHLFGILNNGITVIADDINIVTSEVTLTNYQIVNGCQTCNVLFESESFLKTRDIYIPIRLISTQDEDTKQSIIKATNSQTALKPEQIAALKSEQKDLEEYYKVMRKKNNFELYYERRTDQYRTEEIQKIKIINIPFQIKATSAMFLDLPHEVSGQYGKVEKTTRGKLFKDSNFQKVYYVSGLAWYRVDAFIRNTDEGKAYRRARWHIMMLFKYLLDKTYLQKSNTEDGLEIDKDANKIAEQLEVILLSEDTTSYLISETLKVIRKYLEDNGIDDIANDRKIFERKETTDGLKAIIEPM